MTKSSKRRPRPKKAMPSAAQIQFGVEEMLMLFWLRTQRQSLAQTLTEIDKKIEAMTTRWKRSKEKTPA